MLQHMLRAVAKRAPSENFPTYVSRTSASGTSNTLTINTPASVASGDLLIAVLVANGTAGWSQLSGWIRLNNITTDPSTSVQYRIADGSEGASFTFTTSSGRVAGTIMRFTGAGIPYVGTANSNANPVTPQTAPSLTITSDFSLQLSVFSSDTAGITWTGVDGTNIIAASTQCSFNIGFSQVNSGATAADTATPSPSSSYAAFQIGIPPDSATTRYVTTVSSTTDLTTYTFSNASIGTAASDRYVIVGFSASTGTAGITISSVTIAGITATLLSKAEYSATSASRVSGIYMAAVPTGTTATIVVTYSSTMARMALNVYRCIGLPTITPHSTASVTGASGTAYTLDVSGSSAGFVIAQAAVQASTSFTWTGLTEDSDSVIEAAITQSAASTNTSASGSVPVTATSGVSGNYAACSVYMGVTPTNAYISSNSSAASQSSYTFTNQDLGILATNRIIIVAVTSHSTTSGAVSSVTINGLATTLTASAAGNTALGYAVLQNGSLPSADIVVSFSDTRSSGCAIAVYSIINPISTSIVDSDLGVGGSGTSAVVNDLSVSIDGFVIASLTLAGTDTVTWTNASSNAILSGVGTRRFHFASATTAAASTTYDITASWASSIGYRISGSSWR